MSADMSLSQSLGGLRIANPDEHSSASPTSSPPPASVSRPPRSYSPPAGGLADDHRPGLQPNTSYGSSDYESYHESESLSEAMNRHLDRYSQQNYDTPTAVSPDSPHRLSHRSSMPFAQQAAQIAQYQSQQSAAYNIPMRHASTSSRPTSAVLGGQGIVGAQGQYRYGGDVNTADGSLSGLARSGSRSVRAPGPAQPARDVGRTYRQPSTGAQSNGTAVSGGSYPARRNSGRRVRAPTGASSSSAGHEAPEAGYVGQSPITPSAEAWRERGAAVGTVREVDASGQSQLRTVKKGVKDFNFGRTLGEGSYSTVLAATDRQNGKEYAIKVLDKRHIIKEKKVKYVNIERDTLNRLTEHPGIVRLYYTFQDERSLYFVLDLASGGELLGVLKKMGTFDLECSRFYGAQILDSIAYMHTRGIIHRDLKPENVLLDRDMHVKITDFGTAKILQDPRPHGTNGQSDAAGRPTDGQETDRAVSFVGTAEYVSPELLREKNACKASDLWAFGCIIYQLLAGRPPFKAANEYLTFQKILALDYSFPDGFPEVARDLIERLLVLEPSKRLSMDHVKSHRFFDGITWGKGLWKQKAPRLRSYMPPPSEPIRLNGPGVASNGAASAASAALTAAGSTHAAAPQQQRRPQLLNVTELPPPSQLDIDWSPVLTHLNERILKLGNLIVGTSQQPHSPKSGDNERSGLARLFSSNNTKKRERLVLITSCARLVVTAAGGNEKKAKMEINLAATLASCKSCTDAKGLTYFSIDTKDKHFTFEDPRATTSDPAGSKYSTQEWLDSIEQAREVALATSSTYSSASVPGVMSVNSSPADSLGGDAVMPLGGPSASENRHVLRHTLRRNNTDEDVGDGGGGVGFGGKKRFSKRHSKSGLAAVF